ncbi:hypothetical protein Zm00014a_008520 [Zea mays]|uniref:Uncharacterized protein n=1 Tax=Zea mays TaxID=4577 RepID=A0A3L6EBW2_MAIZE|nr:hypothetical protein Zm00014a_008520 [Zea mays]
MEKCRSVPHEHSSPYYGGGGGGGPGQAGKSYSFNGPSGRDDPEAKRWRRTTCSPRRAASRSPSAAASVKWLKSKLSDVRYYGGL